MSKSKVSKSDNSFDIAILLKIAKNNYPNEMSKLLVLTGGSKGIGRAIIEKFVEHGFDIATCARNLAGLELLKNKLSGKAEVNIFQADISVRDQVAQFIEFVKKLNRPVDVLVNNAGYFIPGEILTEPEGNLEAIMDTNLYSAYHVTRGVVPQMRKSRSGHIFNICSIASIMAYKNGGSYAISKFAMLGFSKCIREELKESGIRVTSVIPGSTKTDSWADSELPDDRFMKVEDIADMVYASHALSARSVVEELIIRPQLGDI